MYVILYILSPLLYSFGKIQTTDPIYTQGQGLHKGVNTTGQ